MGDGFSTRELICLCMLLGEKKSFIQTVDWKWEKAKKPVDHPCRQLELPATKVIYRSADLTVTACPVTGLDRSLDRWSVTSAIADRSPIARLPITHRESLIDRSPITWPVIVYRSFMFLLNSHGFSVLICFIFWTFLNQLSILDMYLSIPIYLGKFITLEYLSHPLRPLPSLHPQFCEKPQSGPVYN